MEEKKYIIVLKNKKKLYNKFIDFREDCKKMKNRKKVKILKIVLLVLVICLLIGIITYLFPLIKNLSSTEGQIAFKEKVESSGIFGLLLLFGLQFAQIFLIILPGEPIEVLAGMCYGTIGGTIFVTVSAFIITAFIFFLVRKLGRNFVYQFFDSKKIEKIENSKLFKNTKKIEWIMIILFFIPGTPKDLLVYIGGLLPLKPLRFILISTFARLPSVISSAIAGANLVLGNWQMSLIVYVITFIIIGIIMFIINKFDKTNITKEAIETIK